MYQNLKNHFSKSQFLKNCSIFFTFSTKLQIYLSHVKITFSCFDSFKIWSTNDVHLGLHFLGILRKIEESMYYNIANIFTIFFASTGCIINAIELKIFPNTVKWTVLKDFQIGVTVMNW